VAFGARRAQVASLGLEAYTTDVRSVDSAPTGDGGVMVLVTGVLTKRADTSAGGGTAGDAAPGDAGAAARGDAGAAAGAAAASSPAAPLARARSSAACSSATEVVPPDLEARASATSAAAVRDSACARSAEGDDTPAGSGDAEELGELM
jgi:hypothetical protein